MSNGQSAPRPSPAAPARATAAPDGPGLARPQGVLGDPNGPVPAARCLADADDALLALALAALAARPLPIPSPARLPQAVLGLAATDGGSDHVTRPPSFPFRGADPDAGGWS